MSSSIEEILHEDSVKDAINELCEDIKDFEQVDFVHLLWAKKDGIPKGRYYGELDTLLATLAKAQFILLATQREGVENGD